jgi:outer membrane immunogenic protein
MTQRSGHPARPARNGFGATFWLANLFTFYYHKSIPSCLFVLIWPVNWGLSMRRLSLALISAVSAVALTQNASAADLPWTAPAYSPRLQPVIGWTGFYAGLNAGYHWANSDVDTVGTAGPFAATFGPSSDMAAQLATTSLNPKQNDFIGGGQIGYNYQIGQWLAGLEADIQGIAHNSDTASSSVGPVVLVPFTDTFVSTTSVSKQLDWLGTLRGRLGVLVTPSMLAYGTGGLAYGEAKATTTISQTATCVFAACPGGDTVTYGTTGSFSQMRTGWTLGGGLEWMFAPNWSLKGEYLYYDLGSETFTLPRLNAVDTACGACTVPTWSANVQSTTRFNGSIARVGINYLFN